MKQKKTTAKKNSFNEERYDNSLNDLVGGLGNYDYSGVTLSQTATLIANNRFYMLSNDRITLSYAYITHGLVQVIVDQPVDDAFRGGFDIDCKEFSTEQIQELQHYLEENEIVDKIKKLFKWVRLYGGGGMVINAPGDPDDELNVSSIKKNSFLDFYPADLWELNRMNANQYAENKPYVKPVYETEDPYNYYGVPLHRSRVLRINNKEAPSFLRPSLRGWGMSEIERLVRSINQYIKNQDLIFELLDEAKVDLWKIKGFNSSLISSQGSKQATNRIQQANRIKNFTNAVVMDTEDDWQQRQINFSGIAEIFEQNRMQVACDMKMPVRKLFGQSTSSGLNNSGEDELENYNSMVEGEIRSKKHVAIYVIKLCCQKLFSTWPDSLEIKFKPLRILSAEQESNVKTQELNNNLQLYHSGLITGPELLAQCNLGNLTETDVKGRVDDFPTPPPQPQKIQAPIKAT